MAVTFDNLLRSIAVRAVEQEVVTYGRDVRQWSKINRR